MVSFTVRKPNVLTLPAITDEDYGGEESQQDQRRSEPVAVSIPPDRPGVLNQPPSRSQEIQPASLLGNIKMMFSHPKDKP